MQSSLFFRCLFSFVYTISESLSKTHTVENIEIDVVIIGGGPSGIAAAHSFYDAGIDFLLLEAQEKIGGRMQSQEFNGYVIENGANWVYEYGKDDPRPYHIPIWQLKEKYGLKGSQMDWGDSIMITGKGESVNISLVDYFLENQYERIEKLCLNKGELLWKLANQEDLKHPENIDISLEDCFNHYEYTNPGMSELEKSVAMAILESEIDLYLALPSSNVSLMLFTLEEMLRPVKYNGDEEYFFVKDQRGYNHLLREIAKNFSTSIKLRHKVTGIDYDTSGVNVKVTIVDGKSSTDMKIEVRARYAICAVPLGVLQKEVIDFNPPLSSEKMTAIHRMTMGQGANHKSRTRLKREKG